MKKILTLFLAIVSYTVMAQNGTITGQIINEDGIVLPGATVRIENTNLGAVSDVNGEYRITSLENGNYTLTVDYIGFNSTKVDIKLDGSAIQNFTLVAGIELEQVIVVGQNLQGIARALNAQKNNENITNVVSADQMGRFPDANIGDAMKRIPGITMQNDQGEARNVFIRGIAKQYNSVTLNGDRIPSAEGDNRNVQMDLIPADMIQLVEVSKAITPEMDGDAIGGSVNLVTRSATSDPRISATFAPGYAPIRDKPIWTGGLIAGNRFLNDKFGIVFSGSYNHKDYGSDNFEPEYKDGLLDELQIRRYDVTRERISGGLDMDYKFNANHSIRLNTLLSGRKDWEHRYRTVYNDLIEDGSGNFETLERQTKGGSSDNKNSRLEHQKINKFGFSGDHIFGRLQMDWKVSYADASETRPNERYIEYVAENDDPYFTGTITGAGTKDINVVSTESIPASAYKLELMTEEFQFTKEENWKTKMNFAVPVTPGGREGKIKFGSTYKYRTKVRDNSFIDYTDALEDTYGTLADVTTADLQPKDFNPGDEYQIGQQVTEEFLGNLNLANYEGEDDPSAYILDNYDADETVLAGFLQYSQAIGEKWSIITGARIESTNSEQNGSDFNEDDEVTATYGESDYVNFMPSFHTNYRPNKDAVVRLAWTNSIARPNYYDLAPYAEIDREDLQIELGNPDLEPVESMNFDLMAEYYFEEIGLVSFGSFYKKIDNFFYEYTNDNEDYEYRGVVYEEVTQPRNGDVANVYGFETSFQRQLDFFGDFFAKFNLYANYTYTGSDASLGNGVRDDEDLSLSGTAPNVYNFSLAYEDNRFNARLSLNGASDFVDEYGDDAAEDIYYDKQTFLDFNTNFLLKDRWTIFGEAKNLTNQPLRYYQGAGHPERTFQEEFYEPTFNLGVKFDF